MKRITRFAIAFCSCLLFVAANWNLNANSTRQLSLDERIDAAAAICRGRIVGITVFRKQPNGRIYTRTDIRVDEAFKGRFPDLITITHRGGVLHDAGFFDSSAPIFAIDEERIFFLGRRPDDSVFSHTGSRGAPLLTRIAHKRTRSISSIYSAESENLLRQIRLRLPDPAVLGEDLTTIDMKAEIAGSELMALPGLKVDPSGIASRFISGDRGKAIEYLVDADILPPGINQSEALKAVEAAFETWSAVTTLKFAFRGIESFGQAAGDVNKQDGRIRIQLHDLHGFIDGSSTLGVGGNDFLIASNFPNGGMGGNVDGTEFYPVNQGFVTIRHTDPALTNLKTFEEVLCHEIGHVLSMAHSSENQDETDFLLRDAIMFQLSHRDGRGAQLGDYDAPIIQQAYPLNNTPPYGYDRVLDVVPTVGLEPSIPEINQIEFRTYDLQDNNLTVTLVSQSGVGAGEFSLNGNILRFTPSGFFNGPRLDPSTSSYGLAFLRISDGKHGSPFNAVKVISLQSDDNPRGAPDGLPDEWVAMHFGDASANIDPLGDADGDGISNVSEFLGGTNPTNPADALQITSVTKTGVEWRANPYNLYEVHGTHDFRDWFRLGNPVLPLTSTGSLSHFSNPDQSPLFLRVLRVP